MQSGYARQLLRPLSGVLSSPLAQQRRHLFKPVDWFRQRLAPNIKQMPTTEDVQAAKKQAIEEGTASVFEQLDVVKPSALAKAAKAKKHLVYKPRAPKPKPESHKYSTANFKISPRKLNMLGRQISGKPIDWAILQMQFSEKRASTRLMNMLATARDHAARYKRLEQSKLVVAEAWVSKGQSMKRLEPRGRGKYGIRTHQYAKLSVVLKEGKTLAEKKAEERKKKLDRVVSASLVREDVPIRNPAPTWTW